jgi:hypothetical protein
VRAVGGKHELCMLVKLVACWPNDADAGRALPEREIRHGAEQLPAVIAWT